MAKDSATRYNEAMERMADRITRTDSDQLELIKTRPGKSLKEVARLTAHVLNVKVKKPKKDKPVLAKEKVPYKKGRSQDKSKRSKS